jgi:hypothetical protein
MKNYLLQNKKTKSKIISAWVLVVCDLGNNNEHIPPILLRGHGGVWRVFVEESPSLLLRRWVGLGWIMDEPPPLLDRGHRIHGQPR